MFFQKEHLKSNARKSQEKGVPNLSLPTFTKFLPPNRTNVWMCKNFRSQDVLREYGFVNDFVK